jgi:hypothetical protein
MEKKELTDRIEKAPLAIKIPKTALHATAL